MTLKTRLVLWFSGTLASLLIVFSSMLVLLQPRVGMATLDAELRDDVVTVAGVLDTETRELGPGADAVAGMLDELHLPGKGLAVFDPAGVTLGAQWNALEPLTRQALTPTPPEGARTVRTSAGDARWHVEAITAGQTRYLVAVVASLEPVVREGMILRRAVLIAVPVALLLASVGGWIAATQAIRPVSRMAVEAAAITAEDPRGRLTTATRRDEMGTLASAFNGLLDRLGAALQQQRQFMADASHELRTPVSVVRTAADVMLSQDARTEADYRESFGIVQDQARRLSRMVDDMFLLARVDAHQRALAHADFYLDEVVEECSRSLDVLAARKEIVIERHLSADLSFAGDEGLARQLVTNILENAVRHSPQGAHVLVRLTSDRTGVRLSISDSGPGVAADHREHIFERFVKLDPTRGADSGAGLGLSIARWVAEAHGGTLVLRDSGPGGSTFEAWLPRATPMATREGRTIDHADIARRG